jgi:hypothetical protein
MMAGAQPSVFSCFTLDIEVLVLSNEKLPELSHAVQAPPGETR